MSNLAKIERELMNLAPEEREHLALSAWESLGDGSDAAIIGALDSEGTKMAKERDRELSSGVVKPISYFAFLERISTNE